MGKEVRLAASIRLGIQPIVRLQKVASEKRSKRASISYDKTSKAGSRARMDDPVLQRARRLLGSSNVEEHASSIPPVDVAPRRKDTYKASVISGSTLVNTHEVCRYSSKTAQWSAAHLVSLFAALL